MRARRVAVFCMLSMIPLAGCVDSLLDDGAAPEEAVDANGSNESDGNDTEVIVGGAPDAPDFEPGPTTTTPAPAPAPPASTTPPAPVEAPTPTPPAPEPTPATPTPPPPAPTPPPPTPTPPSPTPPAEPAWPREGSFVTYTFRTGQAFAGSDQQWEVYGNVTWTYRNGDWSAECSMQRYERFYDGSWENTTATRRIDASTPPHWPVMNTRSPPAPGETVTAWYVKSCGLDQETLVYRGTQTEPSTVNGQPVVAQTHFAEDDWPEEQPMSWRTEWSQRTGLVIYWSYARGGSAPHSDSGRLVNTDAPL